MTNLFTFGSNNDSIYARVLKSVAIGCKQNQRIHMLERTDEQTDDWTEERGWIAGRAGWLGMIHESADLSIQIKLPTHRDKLLTRVEGD